MRIAAVATCLLGGAALAGCGGEQKSRPGGVQETVATRTVNGVETARLADASNDVQARAAHSDPARPPKAQLDLRRVEIRRDRKSLRVGFTTAAPPGPGTTQRLEIFTDLPNKRQTTIEATHPREGGVRGVTTTPDRFGRKVKASAAGRTVTVEAPLDDLTRAGAFKWRARTLSGSPVEIDDHAPSTLGDYRFFPR